MWNTLDMLGISLKTHSAVLNAEFLCKSLDFLSNTASVNMSCHTQAQSSAIENEINAFVLAGTVTTLCRCIDDNDLFSKSQKKKKKEYV